MGGSFPCIGTEISASTLRSRRNFHHWPGIVTEGTLSIEKAIRKYLQENLPEPGKHRLYFDHGTETLDRYYPPMQHAMDRGYDDSMRQTSVFVGHAHDKESWNTRLNQVLVFLSGIEKQTADQWLSPFLLGDQVTSHRIFDRPTHCQTTLSYRHSPQSTYQPLSSADHSGKSLLH